LEEDYKSCEKFIPVLNSSNIEKSLEETTKYGFCLFKMIKKIPEDILFYINLLKIRN